jgi:uncharacterized protein YjbJ (UPF0337 family)
MDNAGIIDAGKQVIGAFVEGVGKLVGDAKLQVDGHAEQ